MKTSISSSFLTVTQHRLVTNEPLLYINLFYDIIDSIDKILYIDTLTYFSYFTLYQIFSRLLRDILPFTILNSILFPQNCKHFYILNELLYLTFTIQFSFFRGLSLSLDKSWQQQTIFSLFLLNLNKVFIDFFFIYLRSVCWDYRCYGQENLKSLYHELKLRKRYEMFKIFLIYYYYYFSFTSRS